MRLASTNGAVGAGSTRVTVNAVGTLMVVVNPQTGPAVTPCEFRTFTLQKYCILGCKPASAYEVAKVLVNGTTTVVGGYVVPSTNSY